jgi:predicted small lipoprotein YifL
MSNSWKVVVVASFVAALVALAGCGKKDDAGAPAATGKADAASSDAGAASTEEQMAKQAADMRKALAEMNDGKEVKLVESKDLKALLPETLGGGKRAGVESQRMSHGGIDIASMKTSYDAEPSEGGDGAPKPGFNVEILDLGNLGASMAMGYAAWAMTQFEKETETGYEKTTKHKGYPAMEKYDREQKSGELHVYVAKRFVLQVSGHDATIEQIRAVVDGIDVDKLAALAK